MNPFVLNDLPSGSWSVTWPGFEYVVINDPNKATKLLGILFDEVKVDQAQLLVQRETEPDPEYILYLDCTAYYQDPDGAGRFLAENESVVACKFPTQDQAIKFKTAMEKRLVWRRLGGAWV
jgi:hypothetical protein